MNLTDVKKILERANKDEKFKEHLIEALSNVSEMNPNAEFALHTLLVSSTEELENVPNFNEEEIKEIGESLRNCDSAYVITVKKVEKGKLEIHSSFSGDAGYFVSALNSDLEKNDDLFKLIKKAIEPVILKKLFS